jgi:heme/copper-type cytochrome/quinol oxidase subunit 4
MSNSSSPFYSDEVIAQNRTTFAVRAIALLFVGNILAVIFGSIAFVVVMIGSRGSQYAEGIVAGVLVAVITWIVFLGLAVSSLAKSRVPLQFAAPKL